MNLFGFGLATAIATYAAVAMLALAPATLTLLGRAAWWLPGRGSLPPRRDGDPTRWPRQATASARDDQAASPASPIEQ